MQFIPEEWKLQRVKLGGLQCVLILPANKLPASLIVLCHGYGASGADLVGLFEEVLYKLPEDTLQSAYLFPEAPIDLSDEGMYGSRAWWRLNMAQLMLLSQTNSFDQMRDVEPEGIQQARDALCACIQECVEKFGWSDAKIILGGFSQGAMLTVDTAMRGNLTSIAGLLLFSGALICESSWRNSTRLHPLQLPFVQSHGRLDPILPFETGKWLHELMLDAGCHGPFLQFDGQHTIPLEAIEHSAQLIARLTSK